MNVFSHFSSHWQGRGYLHPISKRSRRHPCVMVLRSPVSSEADEEVTEPLPVQDSQSVVVEERSVEETLQYQLSMSV